MKDHPWDGCLDCLRKERNGHVDPLAPIPTSPADPVCQFCGEPADHKCFDRKGGDPEANSCGDCCGNMGELAGIDRSLYKWVWRIVRSKNAALRVARAGEGNGGT